uniref:Uncharacterized protein n=1 Tax=Salix viminalis TaxID=40686 RepID=A0A6N2N368_SALVM
MLARVPLQIFMETMLFWSSLISLLSQALKTGLESSFLNHISSDLRSIGYLSVSTLRIISSRFVCTVVAEEAPSAAGEEENSGNLEISSVPEDGFEKELMGLTGGFPGGEKGLEKFIEENPPPKKQSVAKLTITNKPKPPELPLLLPGMTDEVGGGVKKKIKDLGKPKFLLPLPPVDQNDLRRGGYSTPAQECHSFSWDISRKLVIFKSWRV